MKMNAESMDLQTVVNNFQLSRLEPNELESKPSMGTYLQPTWILCKLIYEFEEVNLINMDTRS